MCSYKASLKSCMKSQSTEVAKLITIFHTDFTRQAACCCYFKILCIVNKIFHCVKKMSPSTVLWYNVCPNLHVQSKSCLYHGRRLQWHKGKCPSLEVLVTSLLKWEQLSYSTNTLWNAGIRLQDRTESVTNTNTFCNVTRSEQRTSWHLR